MGTELFEPIFLSLRIAIIASVIVMVFGTVTGKLMANRTWRGKTILETFLILPLVLPPSVVGFLLLIFFGANSSLGRFIEFMFGAPIIFTWWAGVVAAVVVAFPLMYQVSRAGFETIDRQVEEAARVDGANEWAVFLFITLPLTMKSILTGFILSFTRALGEFGATLMFAGNIPGKTQTISTAIYVAIDSGNMKDAWILVISILIISTSLLGFVQVYRNRTYE
ncbi:molybdate ABC transporter permease subunit [Metabacillus malikii]|uniref:Molybdenum transport system permease n=1 Tax=Metabacillus malikii TaxID=1504265 RepID=A0ABT9ZBC1_9BACI|nr:molybdate ABC transporter permease subunit [Metabacillus malikii]MDQ0229553.1 molybdate transport system permease protein [Metabacillus malikii]